MHLPDHIKYTYCALADVPLHLADGLLSEKEHAYLETVSHAGRRREYTAGRIIARKFAGDILDLDPKVVPLSVAADGSLELPGTGHSISLAHSHEGVCVAIAEATPVGIDVETIKPRHAGLHRFILHPEEYDMFEALALDRDSALILCWSLKEATLKGLKTGFRCSPKKLKLSIDLDHHQAIVRIDGKSEWQLRFEKRAGCYLAIAYPERLKTPYPKLEK